MTRFKRQFYFILFLTLLFAFLGFFRILPERPKSIHQWAQCDRASVALNYSFDNWNILKPTIHNTANGSGITGMEFPLINYITGMLYRIFGFYESIYRLLMMILLGAGLTAAFSLTDSILKNWGYALLPVLLMYLSPVLAYYTPNFLPDTAGLALILLGWLHFFRFRIKEDRLDLWMLIIFCSLACLIKVTNLISVMVMLIITVQEIIRNRKTPKFQYSRSLLLLFIPVMLCILWYSYASWLSTTYTSSAFLLKIKPIENAAQFGETIKEIKDVWLKQYYSKYMYWTLLLTFAVIIYFYKKADKLLLKVTLFLWLGNLIYFLMMMSQFPEHDYYIISMVPAIFFQLLTFVKIAISAHQPLNYIVITVFVSLLIHGAWFSRHVFQDRYDPGSWMASDPKYGKYNNLGRYLKELGINRNQRAISAVDNSTQNSLYLMDLKGVTVSENAVLDTIFKVYKKYSEFVILNDTNLLFSNKLTASGTKLIGSENNIYIYKILNRQ